MRIFLSFFAVLVLFPLLVMPVFASDVTNAEYLTTISVINSSTAASNVVGVFTSNTSEMISGDMLSANASDVALRTSFGIDIPFMPGISGNPWVFYLSSIGAHSQLNEYLYSKNVTGGKINYFPGDAGLQVADNDTMEWGSNGGLSFTGWLDTTQVGANITSHQDTSAGGMTVSINATGKVQASIYKPLKTDLSFDGGDYCSKTTPVVAPSGATMTIECWVYIDAVGLEETFVFAGDYTGWNFLDLSKTSLNKILFRFGNVGNSAYACYWTSTNATLATTWYHIVATYDANAATEPRVYVNGAEWGGADTGDGTNMWQASGNMTLGARKNAGAFQALLSGDIDEVRISNVARTLAEAQAAYNGGVGVAYTVDANTISLWHLNEATGTTATDETGNNNLTFGAAAAAPTWANTSPVSNLVSASTSLSGISSGEKDLAVSLSGGTLTLNIDGTTNTTAYAGNVPNSTNSWTFFANNSVLYMESANMTKGGVLVSAWDWEYDTTFHDSVGANDATPSFRTTASDADVSAAISSQESLITSESPATAESGAWSMLTDAEKALLTVTPPGLYSEGGILFPGGQTIQDFADDTRYPVTFYLYPLAIFSSIALGMFVMAKTHNPSRGIRGSLMLQAGTSLVCMVLWVFGGGGVIAGWILIPFGVWCAVLLLWRNPYNPAT